MLVGALLMAGCGAGTPPEPDPTGPPPTQEPQARAQLAGLAAAAQDRTLAASYVLSVAGRPDRTVAVWLATDGSWRVDIPGGALGGTADVAVASTGAGLFQCALARPVVRPDRRPRRPARPRDRPADPATVRVRPFGADQPGRAAGRVVGRAAGRRDRQLLLGRDHHGLGGAPLDVGIYCYADDGTLTGARLSFGTLVLAGAPAAAPPSITMPGPVTGGSTAGDGRATAAADPVGGAVGGGAIAQRTGASAGTAARGRVRCVATRVRGCSAARRPTRRARSARARRSGGRRRTGCSAIGRLATYIRPSMIVPAMAAIVMPMPRISATPIPAEPDHEQPVHPGLAGEVVEEPAQRSVHIREVAPGR